MRDKNVWILSREFLLQITFFHFKSLFHPKYRVSWFVDWWIVKWYWAENCFTRHCRERRRKPKCQRSVNHFIIWLIDLFFFTLLFDCLIDWFIWFIWLFDLFQCLLKYLNYHLISIYLCGFSPGSCDHFSCNCNWRQF